MPAYASSIREEELKNRVAADVFGAFDGLAYTLFHGQNRISCGAGNGKQTDLLTPNGVRGDVVSRVSGEQIRVLSCPVNHWIPFREAEVDAKEAFRSHFMAEFLERAMGGAASGRGGTADFRNSGIPGSRSGIPETRDPENPAPIQPLLFGGGAPGFGEERGGRRNPEAECNASREIGSRAEGEEGNDLRPVSTSNAKQTSLPLRSAGTPRFQSLAGKLPAPPEPLAAEGGESYDGAENLNTETQSHGDTEQSRASSPPSAPPSAPLPRQSRPRCANTGS